MMELREDIESAMSAQDREKLARFDKVTQDAVARESADLTQALKDGNTEAARVAALRLRYWQRAVDALAGDEPLD
jgi:DnaJ-domain-containing protein 1